MSTPSDNVYWRKIGNDAVVTQTRNHFVATASNGAATRVCWNESDSESALSWLKTRVENDTLRKVGSK